MEGRPVRGSEGLWGTYSIWTGEGQDIQLSQVARLMRGDTGMFLIDHLWHKMASHCGASMIQHDPWVRCGLWCNDCNDTGGRETQFQLIQEENNLFSV